MGKLFTFILAIACTVVLVIGNSHWEEKTRVSAEKVTEMEELEEENEDEVLPLAANWPDEAQQRFTEALAEGEPYRIAFLGSEVALGRDDNAWPTQTKQKLLQAFGEEHLQISTYRFKGTTDEYIEKEEYSKLIKEKTDFILFEPFTLIDNGEVDIQDSLKNIQTIIHHVQQENPQTVFILQPAYPLYNTKEYPKQVEALKDFAKEENITYLDHWTAWPNTKDKELQGYLTKKLAPNDKGNRVWSEYLLDYFIKKRSNKS